MQKLIKKQISIVALSTYLFFSTNVHASGIPTVDLGAIAQMVQQITVMKQQYETIRQQFEEAKRLTEKFEGVSGIGEGIKIEVMEVLFPELAEALADLTYENMPSGAQDIFNERGYDKACPTDSLNFKECQENYVYLATSQHVFQQSAKNTQQLSDNLKNLEQEIANADTQKKISDLQARISAEAAQIQLAQFKADQLERTIRAARENAIEAQSVKLKKSFWGSN